MPKIISTDTFILRAKELHGEQYDYHLVDYKAMKERVSIICPVHGIFEQTPDLHIGRGCGCRKCTHRGNAQRTNGSNRFIPEARLVHGDRYDYSLVDYKTARQKVIIICPDHGQFQQMPDKHLKGQSCPRCKPEKLSEILKDTKEEFLDKARLAHGDRYGYDEVEYKNSTTPVIIFCKAHGFFNQSPVVHVKGHGCKRCGNDNTADSRRKSTSEFIADATAIHGSIYDYDQVEYSGALKKVVIVCERHGVFSQSPHDHLAGYGCPRCVHRISKGETEWLDSLSVKDRQFKIPLTNRTNKLVDGYDPLTRTVYEYYGDFWHGNPNLWSGSFINPVTKCSMGELYEKTIEAERLMRDAGYTVVAMWERDWTGRSQAPPS